MPQHVGVDARQAGALADALESCGRYLGS
jgi:hypothetical protein